MNTRFICHGNDQTEISSLLFSVVIYFERKIIPSVSRLFTSVICHLGVIMFTFEFFYKHQICSTRRVKFIFDKIAENFFAQCLKKSDNFSFQFRTNINFYFNFFLLKMLFWTVPLKLYFSVFFCFFFQKKCWIVPLDTYKWLLRTTTFV